MTSGSTSVTNSPFLSPLIIGTDQNTKPETEVKQNGHSEGEKGSVDEERKRKLEESSANGDQQPEDQTNENSGLTDVNGNEGPDAKKRKLGYVESGHKSDVVRKKIRLSVAAASHEGCIVL